MKKRFQDITMQIFYEDLIKQRMHWKKAEKETILRFKEYYDGGLR